MPNADKEPDLSMPRSDAAKFTLKSTILGSLVGAIVSVDEAIRFCVETMEQTAHGETAAEFVGALGFTAIMATAAFKAPQAIDRLIDRHYR